jgi:hypothetical protein
MPLPGSLPLALSQIKTEFGGGSTLAGYYRGGGRVANHTANAAIPTSGTIAISNFLGTERNFTCSMNVQQANPPPLPLVYWGYVSGTVGSASRTGIGTSPSSTAQTTFVGWYDQYTPNFSPPPDDIYVGTFLVLSGNVTGTWWTDISWGSLNLTRASSSTPNGAFNGTDTTWDWYGGPYFGGTGSATFTLTLA